VSIQIVLLKRKIKAGKFMNHRFLFDWVHNM